MSSIKKEYISCSKGGFVGIFSHERKLYLITFGSILSYSAYMWLLKICPAKEVAIHTYVNPFIAVILSIFMGKGNVS